MSAFVDEKDEPDNLLRFEHCEKECQMGGRHLGYKVHRLYRVHYMGRTVRDCTQATAGGEEQDLSLAQTCQTKKTNTV